MSFEEFSRGDSLLHGTDIRIKLAATVLLSLVLAVGQCFSTALAGLSVGVALVFVARLAPRAVTRRLLIINGFTLMLWLTLPLTYPGDELVRIGPFVLSSQGVAKAALITLKTNGMLLIFISLASTSSSATLGHGLEGLGVPRKLCLLLLFSYRYIFVINQQYRRLVRAARLRGFQPSGNLHTYRTYANLVGMTLVMSWERAERVHQAMVLRGFDGRFYTLEEQTVTRSDRLFLLAALITTLAMAALEMAC
ncbi:MAG: cobalt ECF transporter T component CbiQ [Thermodesulfobacteriota bacterium]